MSLQNSKSRAAAQTYDKDGKMMSLVGVTYPFDLTASKVDGGKWDAHARLSEVWLRYRSGVFVSTRLNVSYIGDSFGHS